jgi:hypothetical protein
VRQTFLTFEPRAPRTRLRRSERHNFRLPSETAATVVDRQSRVSRYELCSWRVIISQFPLSHGRVLSESSTCFCPQWKQSFVMVSGTVRQYLHYRHFSALLQCCCYLLHVRLRPIDQAIGLSNRIPCEALSRGFRRNWSLRVDRYHSGSGTATDASNKAIGLS